MPFALGLFDDLCGGRVSWEAREFGAGGLLMLVPASSSFAW